MVRNHSEQVRGKASMVINYKSLNDNTSAHGYKLPDKSELINRIQGKKIFSKFDCKSGYWQVKMYLESINGQLLLVQKDILNGSLCLLV